MNSEQTDKQTNFLLYKYEKKRQTKYKSEQADDDFLIKINYKKPRLEKNLLINDLLFIVLSIYTSKEH